MIEVAASVTLLRAAPGVPPPGARRCLAAPSFLPVRRVKKFVGAENAAKAVRMGQFVLGP